jgi:hypothetical protein
VYWYKYDNALLKSTAADLGSAIYIQNKAVQELGQKADELKANYEQANKRASQIAVEGQKTLREVLNKQLIGTCDDKVRQVNQLVKGALK